MTFDPVAYANEELVPILKTLCALAEQEQQSGQQAFFASLLAGLEHASAGEHLAETFMRLSESAFMGFEYSAPVAFLLDELLEKAQSLSELLSLDASEIH